jgi:3-oxoacyl-[acyl-carrier protein] reductase
MPIMWSRYKMDLGLTGKRVAVTGGSRGIGRAVVEAFLQQGAQVLAIARNQPDLDILARAEGCRTLAADLSNEGGAAALHRAVCDMFGMLDVLVCNVGSGRSVPAGEETAAEWRRMLDINLFPTVLALEACRDLLAEGGAVICVSSIASQRALGTPVPYAAAKAALDALVINSARSLAGRGVRIVGVAPGNIVSPGSVWERKSAEDKLGVIDMLQREVPLGRLGAPKEVADVVVFLASRPAGFITGTIVTVDGGQAGVV